MSQEKIQTDKNNLLEQERKTKTEDTEQGQGNTMRKRKETEETTGLCGLEILSVATTYWLPLTEYIPFVHGGYVPVTMGIFAAPSGTSILRYI